MIASVLFILLTAYSSSLSVEYIKSEKLLVVYVNDHELESGTDSAFSAIGQFAKKANLIGYNVKFWQADSWPYPELDITEAEAWASGEL